MAAVMRDPRPRTARPARFVPADARPRPPRALAGRATARAALRLVALLAALPLAAHGADVRIAAGDRVAHALLADAVARGAFEREGVDVAVVVVDDPVAAVADGDAELAATTADALLDAGRYALELRAALLLGFALDGEAVLGGADVTGLTALRGRAVAVEPRSSAELLLGHALQRVGLSLDDVRAVAPDPDPAAVAAALADGTLAAAALSGAALARVEASAAAGGSPVPRRLASAADRPGLVTDVLAGEERWLRREKEATKAVIRAWNRTVGRLRRDPGAAAAALAEATGLDPALAVRALAGFRALDVADNVELTRGEYQGAFSDMSEVLERRERVNARGVPSANRYLSLAALRQVAAGR